MPSQHRITALRNRLGKMCRAAAPILIAQSIPELIVHFTKLVEPRFNMRQYLFQRLGFAIPLVVQNPWRVLTSLCLYSNPTMFLWGSFTLFHYLNELSFRDEASRMLNVCGTFLSAGLLAQIFAVICNIKTPQLIGAELMIGCIVALGLIRSIDNQLTAANNTQSIVASSAPIAMNLMMLLSYGISVPCCAASAICLYTWQRPDVLCRIGYACERSLRKLQSWLYPRQSTLATQVEKSPECTRGSNRYTKLQMVRTSNQRGGVTLSDLGMASSSGMDVLDWLLSGNQPHNWGKGRKLGS